MDERIVVAQSADLQLANLAQPRIAELTKLQRGQSITDELGDNHDTKPDPSTVENGAHRGANGEQFEIRASAAEDRSKAETGPIPSSGAHFSPVAIDPLPNGLQPLALLGQEGLAARVGSVDDAPSRHIAQALAPSPVVTIPSPGGPATMVFEAGLGARPGETPGTHAGQPSFPTTTRAGSISFTSPDGVQSVSLGGHLLTGTAQTFPDGTTGSLTASYTFNAATGKGTISYSYTLLDNTLGIPSASFAVVVTDADGHSNLPGTLVISIVDDVPVARADTDALTPGQATADGNVITGAGTTSGPADVQGADGGVSIVGVAAGNGPGGVAPGTVGVEVRGAHGKLTLFANGTYSYVHTAGGGLDVFTYTIRDTDGSLSHTTLTILLGNSAPSNIVIPAPGLPETTVNEAGLPARTIAGISEPAGSHAGEAGFPTTTQSGAITFVSPDGVSSVELGGLVLTASGTPKTLTDATGSLIASFSYDAATGKGTVNYSYTLLDNTLSAPSVSFAVAVTDADGDRTAAGSNLVINILDDAPVAVADTDAVAAGQLTPELGNVLTGANTTSGVADLQGADGALHVVSVAAGSGSAVAVNAGTGTIIAGAFGTLTLSADGSYSYVRSLGLPGGAHNDTFTYAVKDADGSQSTATLTIAVADSSPGGIVVPPPDAGETTVFEAGLPARTIAGIAEPAGSNPAAPTTTQAGTITFTSLDGVSKVELGGLVLDSTTPAGTFADATGRLTASLSYDAATGLGEINYSYTMLDNTLGVPSVSFAVAVTDLDGDRAAGSDLTINIVDDAPSALSDTDAVVAGQGTAETGNVITGTGTTSGDSGADVQGADGAVVAGVAAGNTGVDLVNAGTVGVAIAGAFGKLTLNADGSYSYARTGGSGTDIFTYTIQDGDGSLSNTTLAIVIGDSVPTNIVIPPSGGPDTQVFEAGLPARTIGGITEPAGSHAGDPADPTTTQTGSITFASADGVSKVELGGLTLDSTTPTGTFTDATGSLTASFSYDAATGKGTISYSYILLDNTLGTPTVSFAVAVTDADGDRTVGGNLVVNISDDAPIANADTDLVIVGQTAAEVGNVLTGVGTTSGTADVLGADGPALGGAVVGVALGTSATPVSGGVGMAIAGVFGTLTLNADGSYSYAHTGTPGGGTDTFSYTIRDADGSLSTTTLSIAVSDSSPGGISIPPPGGADTQVFEAGLPARTIGGITEPAGSHAGDPADPTTLQTGTITFTSPDGVSSVELGVLVLTAAGTPKTFTDATGSLTASFSYDAATGKGAISYSYTLLDNTLGVPSVSFAVAVTDADDDRTPGGNLVISIVDDAPVANADADLVAAGQTVAEIGNVLTGVGTTSSTADVQGADGALHVVNVAAGTTVVDVDPTAGATIAGAFGTLTLSADGSYSYVRDIGVPGGGHNDIFTYAIKDADGSRSTATLTIAVANSSPGDITVPPPDDGETTVFEAGLGSRGTEPAGSNPAAPTTTQAGTITFTSLDGVGSVELGSLVLHAGDAPKIFTDATGELTASLSYDATTGLGEVDYSYTLLDNTLGISSVSFAVAVTDLDGDRATGSDLTISIVDDAPFALSDTDAVVAGQTSAETGNVLTGVGTMSGDSGTDILGADGAVVAGVAAGNTGVDLVNAGTVGVAIAGAFGTLTLSADGSYSYVRTGGSGTDIFTYTIKDGDGSLSTTTLTVEIGGSVPSNILIPPVGGADTQVFEAGLGLRGGEPAGSHAGESGFPATTQTGTITFTSPDGVKTIELGGLTLDALTPSATFTDATGSLSASYTFNAATGKGAISYSYTLLDNTLGIPSTNFAVAVTDLDGDRAQGGNLVIGIVDDAPVAIADADSVAAGVRAETGNVLTGAGTAAGIADVLGADGAVVAGVLPGLSIADIDDPSTLDTQIQGDFGTLRLSSDGSYTYSRDAGAPGGVADIFTYTIKDADGDLASATLTIGIATGSAPDNINIPAPGGADTTVNEAGLLARTIAGVAEPAGSHAGDPSFPTATQTGSITFTSTDGLDSVELGSLVFRVGDAAKTLTDATGSLAASLSYDATTGLGAIHYSYTLHDNTRGVPSVSFAVAVTDADGDRTPGGNLTIRIVDDAPVAHVDTDFVAPGQLTAETGNVITAAGTTSPATGADTQGADGGVGVAGVAAGDTGVDLVSDPTDPTVNTPILGTFGTLTLAADGTYSYVRDARAPGGVNDVFTYTIADADGSLSHNTLTITIGDSAPGGFIIPAGGPAATVFEAGLLASRGPGESAGSDPTASTTAAGQITFTSVDGVQTVSLGGHALSNTNQTFTDATGFGLMTASYSYDATTNAGTINYSYTLADNPLIDPLATVFSVAVTDNDGDKTTAGVSLNIAIIDDAPVARADTDLIVAGQITAETGNLISGLGTAAGTVNADLRGADGAVVAGVVEGDVGANLVSASTVGTGILGLFGTLTLNADGSYSYARNIGVPGGAHIDTFTYTLQDADGDLSHATLAINVADSAPGIIAISPPPGPAIVFEAGLPARGGESPGSHSGESGFPTTISGQLTFTSVDGVASVSIDGHSVSGTPRTFSDSQGIGTLTTSYAYDVTTAQYTIDYRYTLLDNAGRFQTQQAFFDLAVTDLDGDSASGLFLNIAIADDEPVAHADTDSVAARQSAPETGNVITGAGTTSGAAGADALGADGGVVVSVVAGVSSVNTDLPGTVGVSVVGESGQGRLTLFADGSYSFDPSGLPTGGFTTFTYTIKDGDASSDFGLSHATLTFSRDDIGGNIIAGSNPLPGAGIDTLTGGSGANHILFNAPSEGGAHILDFKSGTDSIDVLLAGFAGLAGKGAVASTDFVVSNNASTANLGAAHFAYNASNGQLFYDSNGGDASAASRILLAVLDNHAALAATDIHKV